MALNLQEKKTIVDKIHKLNNISLSAIIADARGIKSNHITELRKNSKKIGVEIKLVPNNLLRLSIQNTHFECLKQSLSGPLLIGYSLKHPGSAARLFQNFSKEHQQFKITSAVFEKKLLLDIQINQLAEMPTYKEAITRLLFIIKDVSIGKIIRVLLASSQKK
ncbi:MAG: 50S ribosomal protein L10 [Buchnera aphidicola (Eriosoma harunire)]